MNNHVKEISLLAISTSILIVQEYVLQFLPNIQLTTLLILVYTYVFGLKKTSMIVLVHVFIDNLLLGSIGMIHVWLPMLLAWLLITFLFSLLIKKTHNLLVYAFSAYLFGHLYGLIFVPFQGLLLNVPMIPYLIADIPFQLIMAITNFLTILWLFPVLSKFLSDLYKHYQH
ncbi:MAG: hypothetical protein AB7E09_05935 [Candidatus Izemoplasmatales bacterium]